MNFAHRRLRIIRSSDYQNDKSYGKYNTKLSLNDFDVKSSNSKTSAKLRYSLQT